MATQTEPVRGFNWTFPGADDLGDVTVSLNVQAAIPVAIFTLDPLLGVKSVPGIADNLCMATLAGLGAHAGGARNCHVLGETADLPIVVFSFRR
jgi:hypothetical protein